MTQAHLSPFPPLPLCASGEFIETIIDQLKNISQIEHSRHRSITFFVVNVLCGLIAYCRRLSKPSWGLDEYLPLPA
jgi:hypothetical protein